MARRERSSFAEDFERQVLKARRKAGRKVGGLIMRAQRRKLKNDGAGKRRQKAVQYVVAKRTGTLVLLDHAPLAEKQEFGGTVRGNEYLKVPTQTGWDAGGYDRNDVFAKRVKGKLMLFQKAESSSPQRILAAARLMGRAVSKVTAIPIATLVRSVTLQPTLKFFKTADRFANKYVEEIEKEISKL